MALLRCRTACAPPTISGCTAEAATNYDSTATVMLNGSCSYQYSGCTDSAADNFLAEANSDDGNQCSYPIPGCTDPAASNYDSVATISGGAPCAYPLVGCMDSTGQVSASPEPSRGCASLSLSLCLSDTPSLATLAPLLDLHLPCGERVGCCPCASSQQGRCYVAS